MKKYSLFDLQDTGGHHFLAGIMEGAKLHLGGLHFYHPGEYSHPEGHHIHEDSEEVFICLQGRAKLIVDGVEQEMRRGDIALIEPGEEHHLLADEEDPIVNLWLHAE
jgi:quercetin dioxygenase-like cupin family protein